ncbi:MAG: glycosyltransferase family 9 protein [Bacteroidales bacterium]|nr:glycosyltransferase family 9 protein [Bacteroidales bacterium]
MNKLLVIRFSAIGDVALSVLAVRALREAYPDLDITVVTREHLLCLFEDIPNLSFYMVPHHPEWEDRLELIHQLKDGKFDVIADLQNTFTSRTLCQVIACRGCRVERFDRCRKPLRKLTKHRPGAEPVREEVLRFLDVFARLGFPVNPPAVKRKTLPVPEVFGPKEGRWVGLAPFTTKLTKMYPLDSAAEVVRRLQEEFDKVFIFSGANAEQHFCEEMTRLYPRVETVYGRTTLAGEVALISNLDVLVCAAGATMHMARLTGAPIVALWGGTHPDCGYGAYGANPERDYLQLDLPCRPCSAFGEGYCRREDYACLNRLTPDMILDKVHDVVGKK